MLNLVSLGLTTHTGDLGLGPNLGSFGLGDFYHAYGNLGSEPISGLLTLARFDNIGQKKCLFGI